MWKLNTLFCEGKDKNLSIGRVGLWVCLIPAVFIWVGGDDIKAHHMYALGFFLFYNGYKKMDMIVDLIKAWKSTN